MLQLPSLKRAARSTIEHLSKILALDLAAWMHSKLEKNLPQIVASTFRDFAHMPVRAQKALFGRWDFFGCLVNDGTGRIEIRFFAWSEAG
jgi:hypothetical protein